MASRSVPERYIQLGLLIGKHIDGLVVSAGDSVADGDTLVILESMKMEIPVVAETAGTVQELRVNEGDVVQEGDVIAVIG